MAEILFSKIFIVSFILFLHLESFYYLCYSPVVFLNKVLKISKTNQVQFFLINQKSSSVYLFIVFLSLFFYKSSSVILISLLFMSCVFLFKVSGTLDKLYLKNSPNNIIYLVLPSFILFLYILFFIKSLLTLFFFIELYGVLYYFCFLTSYNFTNQTILKYKNGLLLLLWNNFLTTFFLGLGCFFLAKNSGSTDFVELTLLRSNFLSIYFFLLGVFWKLGLPLFHFFKLEVYKYLLKENVFLFSIVTTLTNIIILYVCFTQPVFFSVVYSNNFLSIILLFAINLALVNLKLVSFLQFFAFSGVFTITTILTIFLI